MNILLVYMIILMCNNPLLWDYAASKLTILQIIMINSGFNCNIRRF